MTTRRQRRVAELIHRELSLILLREVRDPRLAEITITDVRVTPDLLIARIYFTVLGVFAYPVGRPDSAAPGARTRVRGG